MRTIPSIMPYRLFESAREPYSGAPLADVVHQLWIPSGLFGTTAPIMNKRNLEKVIRWKAASLALHGWKYPSAVFSSAWPANHVPCINGNAW